MFYTTNFFNCYVRYMITIYLKKQNYIFFENSIIDYEKD